MLVKRHCARFTGLGRTSLWRNLNGMNAVAFDDINTTQLRKLAHARTAVRRQPRTPIASAVLNIVSISPSLKDFVSRILISAVRCTAAVATMQFAMRNIVPDFLLRYPK